MRALVVFTDDGPQLLCRSFRHCFVCVDDGLYWIALNTEKGRLVPNVAGESANDLAAYFHRQRYLVIETETKLNIRSPFIARTCVGMVKAVLGLRAPFVLTPYQLYEHLRKP